MFQVLCTAVVVFIFFRMSFGYGALRKDKRYGINKEKAPSLTYFNQLSKVFFVFGCAVTVVGFWTDAVGLIEIYQNRIITSFGLFTVLYGRWKLESSFKSIGKNYSPLFDAYVPHEIVTTGTYQRIRHPIYLYNLFVSFGLAIASGSLLVFCSASCGLFFILKTIEIEESYLTANFPKEFTTYKEKTWKMIPRFF
jgi:protein-S-isoprenylcysteine O-methyltransferase Ste14